MLYLLAGNWKINAFLVICKLIRNTKEMQMETGKWYTEPIQNWQIGGVSKLWNLKRFCTRSWKTVELYVCQSKRMVYSDRWKEVCLLIVLLHTRKGARRCSQFGRRHLAVEELICFSNSVYCKCPSDKTWHCHQLFVLRFASWIKTSELFSSV